MCNAHPQPKNGKRAGFVETWSCVIFHSSLLESWLILGSVWQLASSHYPAKISIIHTVVPLLKWERNTSSLPCSRFFEIAGDAATPQSRVGGIQHLYLLEYRWIELDKPGHTVAIVDNTSKQWSTSSVILEWVLHAVTGNMCKDSSRTLFARKTYHD